MARQGFNTGHAASSPCKNCESSGCGSYHDECEKYLEYKKQCDEILKNISKENEVLNTIRDLRRTYKSRKNTSKVIKSPKK